MIEYLKFWFAKDAAECLTAIGVFAIVLLLWVVVKIILKISNKIN